MQAAKLIPAHSLELAHELERGRPLAQLVAPGRLVELCGPAQTTAAVSVLAELQRSGETCVWIQPAQGSLYPPDLLAAGVDVESLVVVHIPPSKALPGPAGQCRAAELLLRSGGFGLVILDFAHDEPEGAGAWQGRLLGLVRQHEARLLILRPRGREDRPSLGPLISLRIAAYAERVSRGEDPPGFAPKTGRFVLRHEVLKNKTGAPLEPAPQTLRGPWGVH